MKTLSFYVTQHVTVNFDETKFTSSVMQDFNSVISDFGTDEHAFTDHGEHIAQLVALGICEFTPREFVEGYGVVGDVGISVKLSNDLMIEQTEEIAA